MTSNLEELLDSYYEGTVELLDGRYLCFKRLFDYRCTNRPAIEVFIEDLTNRATISLSTYFDGKWIFSTPLNENAFWEHIRPHRTEVREILTRLSSAEPSREVLAYKLKFKFLTDSTSDSLFKLLHLFKGK
jgi:hypothetical protein